MNFENITEENTFWRLFCLTRKLPTPKDTILVFWVSVVTLLIYYWLVKGSLEAVEVSIVAAASMVNSAALSLLGFIFAAYVVFANMTDKKLMKAMSMIEHPSYKMSFLKYGHCNFIKIKFDLLFIVLTAYLGAVIFPTLPKFTELESEILKLLYLFILTTYQAFFILMIMLCKSAIFNVYHFIMTSIRWYAEYPEKSEGNDENQAK